MKNGKAKLFMVVMVLLSSLLPCRVHASALTAQEQPSPIHGEIAYVLGGDIWLLDLFTGNSEQLTVDGNNQLPTWSPDGRYLTYTHGSDLEDAALYILDMFTGETKLLVEDACCGGWKPDSEQISFIATGYEELAVWSIRRDGSAKEEYYAPLTSGLGVYPVANLRWLDFYDEWGLTLPLEIIAESDSGGLAVYRDILTLAPDLVQLDGANVDCWLLAFEYMNDAEKIAQAYEEHSTDGCDFPETAKGVIYIDILNDEIQELSWLAYPSFSPEGLYLVAERYLPNDDPTAAELWGVSLYNTQDGSNQDLVPDALQPVWRPAPPVDPVVQQYAEVGERIVTIEPPLEDGGVLYRVSYLTTGDIQRRDAEFFHLVSERFIEEQDITGLIITADGRVVRDPEIAQRVLQLYHAAYHLYVEPPLELVPEFGSDLDEILRNPLFLAMEVEQLFGTRRGRITEALRVILTDRQASDQLEPVYHEAIQAVPRRGEDAIDAVKTIVADSYASNKALGRMSEDLNAVYSKLDTSLKWGDAGLNLLRLVSEFLFLTHLQQERAGWLAKYVEAFPEGEGSLDRDEIRAVTTVLDEVDNATQQRINIAVIFGKEWLVEVGKDRITQAAANVMAEGVARYGTEISARTVASSLSALSAGLTINGILYGSDALVANFRLAENAEGLRSVFRDGRLSLQERATLETANKRKLVYSGDLADAFRTAYLLETLAATTSQHSYADGIAATYQLPNPLELINWLRGEDWREDVDELHQRADEVKDQVLSDLIGNPDIDAAVSFGLARLPGPVPINGESWTEPQTDMVFVRVPAGTFTMGSSSEEIEAALMLCKASPGESCERDWFENEEPQHQVYLDEYWIGQTQVTNDQYQAFVDAGGYNDPAFWTDTGWAWRQDQNIDGPQCQEDETLNQIDQPVTCISWFEGMAFASWLAKETVLDIRLPTEAEWEKAARGTDARIFPWGNEWDGSRLNYCDLNCSRDGADPLVDDGYNKTAPVGSYPQSASPYGVLDMAGNLWEWTLSSYTYLDYPYVADDGREQTDMWAPRTVRGGGAWYNTAKYARSADRWGLIPVWLGVKAWAFGW